MEHLNLIRSEPDETTQRIIEEVSEKESAEAVRLYATKIDYNRILEAIFKANSVISWW